MTLKRVAIYAAALCFAQTVSWAASDFPTAVSEILNNQTDGPISEMQGDKKQAMIDCVNGVLADLPDLSKNYILKGASYEERESRFGQVVTEHENQWRKKITAGCSEVAMSD